MPRSHSHYAKEGHVIFRFRTRASRDAWIEASPVKAGPYKRLIVTSTQVPQRLKNGRFDADLELELRDGPELAEPA
ncbi:MAG: hypothetical protein JST54_04105 [Deltaproteobacteria bacterium]|nr:hypothetical protein [Deltaproteobacteria bacterium]